MKMIEEIDVKKSLFDVVREEGTIIKRGDYYWIYAIDYEGCEECGRDEEHKGWNNITKIVIEAKKEFVEDIKKNFQKPTQKHPIPHERIYVSDFMELEKKHLNTPSQTKRC